MRRGNQSQCTLTVQFKSLHTGFDSSLHSPAFFFRMLEKLTCEKKVGEWRLGTRLGLGIIYVCSSPTYYVINPFP